MRRRKFLALVGGTAVWQLAAQAQEPGRVYRLGSLHQSPHDAPHHVGLLAELRKSGFTEGVNLIVDMRGYGAHPDQFPELARSQVGAKVDAIVRWRGSWPGSATGDNDNPADRGRRRYGTGRISDITGEIRT